MSKHSSFNDDPKTPKVFYIHIVIIFVLTLTIFLVWDARILQLSPWELAIQFKNSLYLPHHNTFPVQDIQGVHALKLYYKFLLTTIVLAIIFYRLPLNRTRRVSVVKIASAIGLLGVLFFAVIQQVHRINHFSYENNQIGGKTMEDKKLTLFGSKYHFSRICQELLPGHHQAELITDLDFSKSPYMFFKRLLSYQLYPNISIRFNNRSPKDCLILFYKQNPFHHIPDNYEVLFASDDNNYILALQKGAQR
jgi:hypothetical protein